MDRKPDYAGIEQHVNSLVGQAWLGPARRWWPKVLFRTDDVEAAARILNSGSILSRVAVQEFSLIEYDAAHTGVIASTDDRWKHYVRLYFRPRAPTQFVNEGIRPKPHISYGAHCPVPIVLVLDALGVLGRADSQFSDGNLGSRRAKIGNTAVFLANIPFPKVYHDDWVEQHERNEIVFHRHAEVIVPDRLDLTEDLVRFIGCRTQAEFQTLWHLLTPAARARWSAKMGLGTKMSLHYRRWMFVETVALEPLLVTFQFAPSCTNRGPFAGRMEIRAADGTALDQFWESDSFSPGPSFSIRLVKTPPPGAAVTLRLDSRLAYLGAYPGEPDVPF